MQFSVTDGALVTKYDISGLFFNFKKINLGSLNVLKQKGLDNQTRHIFLYRLQWWILFLVLTVYKTVHAILVIYLSK